MSIGDIGIWPFCIWPQDGGKNGGGGCGSHGSFQHIGIRQ